MLQVVHVQILNRRFQVGTHRQGPLHRHFRINRRAFGSGRHHGLGEHDGQLADIRVEVCADLLRSASSTWCSRNSACETVISAVAACCSGLKISSGESAPSSSSFLERSSEAFARSSALCCTLQIFTRQDHVPVGVLGVAHQLQHGGAHVVLGLPQTAARDHEGQLVDVRAAIADQRLDEVEAEIRCQCRVVVLESAVGRDLLARERDVVLRACGQRLAPLEGRRLGELHHRAGALRARR